MAIDEDDDQLDISDEVSPAPPPTPSPVVSRKVGHEPTADGYKRDDVWNGQDRNNLIKTKQVHPREVFSVENHLHSIKEEETAVVQIQLDDRSTPSQQPGRSNQSRTKQWDGKAMNSVSKIDQISRIFFPALFVAINLFYWYTYATPTSE